MIDKYFLRRTKADVFGNKNDDKENEMNEINKDECSSVDRTQR